jgi:hypothetical protein
LFAPALADGAARKLRPARKHRVDVGASFARAKSNCHPIADRRQVGAPDGFMEEPASTGRGKFTLSREKGVGMLVFERDARGNQVGIAEGLERVREGFVPAESGKVHDEIEQGCGPEKPRMAGTRGAEARRGKTKRPPIGRPASQSMIEGARQQRATEPTGGSESWKWTISFIV